MDRHIENGPKLLMTLCMQHTVARVITYAYRTYVCTCACFKKRDARQSLTVSHLGYPSNRLLFIVSLLLNLFACALHSNNALLVVCRRRRPSECHANYKVWNGGRLCRKKWLPQQRPLMDRGKNNFTSSVYSQSSTNPANFVKIGPVDIEISYY